jgi:hypothetical protein
MKRLVAALALCSGLLLWVVTPPAHALDSAYPSRAQVQALLPTARVAVPPFYSRHDRRVTARLERVLEVPSLSMVATTVRMPDYRLLTYAWQAPRMRVSAQRLIFVAGSARTYIDNFGNKASRETLVDGVKVVTQPAGTVALLQIDAKRVILAMVQGHRPQRAALIAQKVARESTGLEDAQRRFVARYATQMVGWQVVMSLNGSEGGADYGPRTRQKVLKVLRSEQELKASQTHYVSASFTGTCLALDPRNGSRSARVHLLFDAASGGHSRVIEYGYGPCS